MKTSYLAVNTNMEGQVSALEQNGAGVGPAVGLFPTNSFETGMVRRCRCGQTPSWTCTCGLGVRSRNVKYEIDMLLCCVSLKIKDNHSAGQMAAGLENESSQDGDSAMALAGARSNSSRGLLCIATWTSSWVLQQ